MDLQGPSILENRTVPIFIAEDVILVLWIVMLCGEDGDNMFLQNFDIYQQVHMALQTRRAS